MQFGKLQLARVSAPVRQHVTKIGGAPVFTQPTAWPRSRSTNSPMIFLGQFVLAPPLFPEVTTPKMAYLFMSDNPEGDLDTWDPASGENALLLQELPPEAECHLGLGPTLLELPGPGAGVEARPVELLGHITLQEPAALPTLAEMELWSPAQQEAYLYENGCKVGGEPDWIQGDECPLGWRLLVQLPEQLRVGQEPVTLSWNFGMGMLYALVNEEATQGILLWQCA